MKIVTLHEQDGIRWLAFGRDPNKVNSVIDTNEYLIIVDGEAMMLDAGGIEIFPTILTAVSSVVDVNSIKHFLCSHQDPDIMSSLPLWLGLVPQARVYLSWLWTGFVAHFGNEYASNFVPIADEGSSVSVGGKEFRLIPAHHCHSAGNFHLFDPQSRILFSGDMGAALIEKQTPFFVEDFDRHIGYMKKFHQRWMPSNEAKDNWVERVRRLNPKMICPQHGSIFKDEQVHNFLDWIGDLQVGRMKVYA